MDKTREKTFWDGKGRNEFCHYLSKTPQAKKTVVQGKRMRIASTVAFASLHFSSLVP